MTPILRRELLGLLRTRQALAMQLGLALACLILVLVRWPTGLGPGSTISDLSGARSQEVMRILGYGLLAGVVLLVPAFPATSLVREKLQGTLALLFNTPLRPWSIYLGKLGGVLGFTAALLIMTLPAAAACYALGGTGSRGGITLLYAVLGLTALLLAALGLLISSYAQSTDGALRGTYAGVLALCIIPLGGHALLQGGSGLIPDLASWFRCLSPIPAVMEVLGHGDVGAFGMAGGHDAVWRFVLLASTATLACALLTVSRLNHTLFDRARPPGVITQERSSRGQVVRRFLFLIDPQRRSGSQTLLVNPVLVKEFRSRRFGRSHWMLRLIAVTAIVSLAFTYIAASGALGWGVEFIGGVLVLLQVALLILFGPSLSAGLVSAERESGSWQLLRMTPLSAGKILRGKLISVAWPLLLLLCATLPGYAVLMTIKPATVHLVHRVAISLLLTGVFVVLVSAAASTLFRSTAVATAAAYLFLLAVCGVPLLVWLGREAPFGHRTVETVLTIDPVAAALQAAATTGFTQYELLPLGWWITGSACAALLVFLAVQMWRLCRPE
jgi:ABC-type transport system involved in multi-copper enzyme maturation permease subunit